MRDRLASNDTSTTPQPDSEPNVRPDQELQGATHAEVADYIADILQELRDLSRASGHTSLGALLELAQREARRDAARAMSVNEAPPLIPR